MRKWEKCGPMARWMAALAVAVLAACGGAERGEVQPAPQAAARGALATAQAPEPQAQMVTSDVIYEWAQIQYYSYFPSYWPYSKNFTSTLLGEYVYRRYDTNNYLGFRGEDTYVLGPVSNHRLTYVGTMGQFACMYNPNACARAPDTGDYMFAVSDYKQSVMRFRNATPATGEQLFGTALQSTVALDKSLAYDASADRLFVSTKTGGIVVIDGASTATDTLTPARTISLTGYYYILGMFLDRAHDRMYVLGARNTDSAIAVIENVSTRSGTISPDRAMIFDRYGISMAIDLVHNTAYVARNVIVGPNFHKTISAFDNIDKASGEVTPAREVPAVFEPGYGDAISLAVDAARDRLYVASYVSTGPDPSIGKMYIIAGASTANGNVAPKGVVLPTRGTSGLSFEPLTDRLIIGVYEDYLFVEQASGLQDSLPAGAVLLKGHYNLLMGPPATSRTQ